MKRDVDIVVAIVILFVVAIAAMTTIMVKYLDTNQTLVNTERAVTRQL